MTTVIATPYPSLIWWMVALCLVSVIAILPAPSPHVARMLRAFGVAVSVAALAEVLIFIQCGWVICCIGVFCV